MAWMNLLSCDTFYCFPPLSFTHIEKIPNGLRASEITLEDRCRSNSLEIVSLQKKLFSFVFRPFCLWHVISPTSRQSLLAMIVPHVPVTLISHVFTHWTKPRFFFFFLFFPHSAVPYIPSRRPSSSFSSRSSLYPSFLLSETEKKRERERAQDRLYKDEH